MPLSTATTSFDVPILFLVFNRPAHTKKIFEQIRNVRPKSLFIAADGPRAGRTDDIRLCEEVRSIVTAIDWECDIKTLFRKNNAGCKQAISSAITWFFEHIEEGIILEDDCLPMPSFFPYMKELLERYRHTTSVALISGYNPSRELPRESSSYFFTRYPFIWGWATWRRSWQSYEVDLPPMDESFQKAIKKNTSTPRMRTYWKYNYMNVRNGYIDTWDYQLVFKNWKEEKLSISPYQNMISNIGFGADSTNTLLTDSSISHESGDISFPLIHPPKEESILAVEKLLESTYYRSWFFLLALRHLGTIKRLKILDILRFLKKIRKN